MKIECTENDYGFWINLTAEDMKDAAFLARLAKNGRASTAYIAANAHADGSFEGYVEVRKRKDHTSSLRR